MLLRSNMPGAKFPAGRTRIGERDCSEQLSKSFPKRTKSGNLPCRAPALRKGAHRNLDVSGLGFFVEKVVSRQLGLGDLA
jgi:hypothetical protein